MSNAERRLIGCILLSADEIVPTLRGVLTADHFADRNYRAIWSTACKLMDDEWPTNYNTIVESLSRSRDIADLASAIRDEKLHGQDWRYYAHLLIEKYERAVVNCPENEPLLPWVNTNMLVLKKSKARLGIASRALKGNHSVDVC